ncbi:NUDIX hydrolase [Phenylobacterium sp.]|uniref:NUDIX hydrolase n=1 Tax=Phenylobacterium sp. TaxID=1871053 RepID=UPI00271B8E0D|nr:NUDIX domain-containing protein [Phenylobacterium sp.]MDO8799692.1 NUDIX domain-containing protein [Phenylobacterium sp.]
MTDRPIPTRPIDARSVAAPSSQAEAAAAFAPLLAAHEPFFDHEVQRPQGRLRVRGYAAAIPVPDILVTAVRAVVFRGSRVVVLSESDGTHHVMPGGRREPGEGLEATVRRELLEECGWRVGALRPFAFLHFQHPGPAAPADWCDFANLIYLTEGANYDRRSLDPTQGKVRSMLMSTNAAFGAVTDRHRAILTAALSAKRAASAGG